MPCVLCGLAHWALDAVLVVANHLFNVNALIVQLAFCSLVLLEAVEMESVATLIESYSSLVLLIYDVS